MATPKNFSCFLSGIAFQTIAQFSTGPICGLFLPIASVWNGLGHWTIVRASALRAAYTAADRYKCDLVSMRAGQFRVFSPHGLGLLKTKKSSTEMLDLIRADQ